MMTQLGRPVLQVRQVGERHWSLLSDVVPKLERQAGVAKAGSSAAPAPAPAPAPVLLQPAASSFTQRTCPEQSSGPDPAARRRQMDAEQDAWAADAVSLAVFPCPHAHAEGMLGLCEISPTEAGL